MIQILTFVNPINNKEEQLYIKEFELDYYKFKHLKEYSNDDDIINILEDIINSLDCTIEYDCGRKCMTTYPIYNNYISEYFYYVIKLVNQYLYNNYIDKLIKRHIDNVIFEYKHPYIISTKNVKTKTKKNKRPPNKFVKQVTHDLFTGKEVYTYFNPRTKESINSNNPNLLDELNASKKKERKKSIKIKEVGVPISAMTFSFKKK